MINQLQANQHTVEIIPDSSVAEGTEIYRMSQVTLQKSDQQVGCSLLTLSASCSALCLCLCRFFVSVT